MPDLKPTPGQNWLHCDSKELRHVTQVDTEHVEDCQPTYSVCWRHGDGPLRYEDQHRWEKFACEAKVVAQREVHDTGSSTHSLSH